MVGVCGGSGFNKGLSTLSSASIAMSHISRLSGSRSLWVSGSEGERVLGRLGLAGGTGGGCAWSFLPADRAEEAACCCLSICSRNCCCSCFCRSFRWSVASLSVVPGARLLQQETSGVLGEFRVTGSCSPCPPASHRGGQLSGSVCTVRSPPGL